jgi:hypothetical protein
LREEIWVQIRSVSHSVEDEIEITGVLGAFTEFPKASSISSVLSARSTVHMELGFHWTDFYEI